MASALPDASVARGAGGQIEATLKNGTNDFHGQFWTYLQNGAWNANPWSNNFQDIPRQPFHQEWYGGNVGGPVWLPKLYNGRNKTFFFVSYERTSTSKNSTTSGQTITPAELQGNFANSPDGIPVINGVPTSTIPTADFGPIGQALIGSGGSAIMPAPTSGTDTFTWNPSFDTLIQTWVVRIDENLGSKNRIFGSLWWYNDNPTFQDMYDEFSEASWATQYPNPKATWGEPIQTKVWAVNETYTITPSMLNNFVLGITQSEISVTNTCSPCSGIINPQNTGINAVGDSLAPDVQQISTPRSMGMDIYQGYVNPTTMRTWDITDNFTWTKGRHTVKTGLELRNFHEVFNQTWGAGADVSFSDSDNVYGGTGNGIADMLLSGGPVANYLPGTTTEGPAGAFGAYFGQNSTQNLIVNYPAREAYIQDSVKVKPRFTVMIGARLQPYYGVTEQKNRFVTFRPGEPSVVFPTAPTGLVTVGDPGISRNLSKNVYNVGPRISFAWDMFGNHKAALKGGYGLYTDYEYLLNFNGYTTAAPYGVDYYPTQGPGLNLSQPYAQYGSTPFPYGPHSRINGGGDAGLSQSSQRAGGGQEIENGLYDKFHLEFEIEPVNTYVFSVAWVATHGTHLFEEHNQNWPMFVPGGSTNDSANVLSREPYYSAGFNGITTLYSDYNSWYNSLQVEVNKRYSHGLTMLGTYTYSNSFAQQGCRYEADCGLDYYSPGTVHQMTAAFRYAVPRFSCTRTPLPTKSLTAGRSAEAVRQAPAPTAAWQITTAMSSTSSSSGCYANYTGGGALLSNRKQSRHGEWIVRSA